MERSAEAHPCGHRRHGRVHKSLDWRRDLRRMSRSRHDDRHDDDACKRLQMAKCRLMSDCQLVPTRTDFVGPPLTPIRG